MKGIARGAALARVAGLFSDDALQGEPVCWRVTVVVPAEVSGPFETAIESLGGTHGVFVESEAAAALIEGYFDRAPDRGELLARLALASASAGVPIPEFSLATLPETDWIAEYRRHTRPITVGRFYIHPSHDPPSHDSGAAPVDKLAIRIDPGLAFGTGAHHSTRGCLIALDLLGGRFRVDNALDLGTGSGVLAIAIAKLWNCPVLAVDVDPVAVRVAGENLEMNGVAALVRVIEGQGYAAPQTGTAGPYDLIVANILADPLIEMAPDLARHLAPGGVAVLSGLLAEQEGRVLAAHEAVGLGLQSRIAVQGWKILVVAAQPASGG